MFDNVANTISELALAGRQGQKLKYLKAHIFSDYKVYRIKLLTSCFIRKVNIFLGGALIDFLTLLIFSLRFLRVDFVAHVAIQRLTCN